MSRYILGSEAAQDLEDIWDYIAGDSVAAADRLISKLFDAFQTLAKRPAIGHQRSDLTAYPVLFWPVGNYLIIYRAEHKRPIEIVAVAQGKRNIPALVARWQAE